MASYRVLFPQARQLHTLFFTSPAVIRFVASRLTACQALCATAAELAPASRAAELLNYRYRCGACVLLRILQ